MVAKVNSQVVAYRVRNLVNGKHYIGVTKRGLGRREHEHRYAARTGSDFLLHKAIRKYGNENFVFEVIFDFDSDYELAMVYEAEAVESERPAYNLVPGGMSRVGPISEATRAKMRAAQLGTKHPGRRLNPEGVAKLRGQKRTEEQRARMSAAQKAARIGKPGTMTGRKHSEETRAKLRAARAANPVGYWSGKKRPEAAAWLSAANMGRPAWNKGVPMREESRAKLSEALKGRAPPPASPLMTETRRTNMRKAAAARRVRVVCLTDGTVHVGIAAVVETYGLSESTVLRLLRSGASSRGGLKFAYEAPKFP